MKPINISKFGKGGLVKPLSRKDYRYEILATAGELPSFYETSFGGKIKNQDGSGSCVSQAVSYYASILNWIETNQWVEFSARDLYSKVYIEPMGSYIKDNMEQLKQTGICLEEDAVSYDKGNPPSEQFMRKRDDITEEEIEKGKSYMILKYVTWDNQNVEMFKRAILEGKGAVVVSWGNNAIWNNAEIELPVSKDQMTWRHGILLIGWDDSKKSFKFINSWGKEWGDNGYGYLPYSYIEQGYVSNPMTMVDVPNDTYLKLQSQIKNLTEMVRLLKIIVELKNKIAQLLGLKK